MTTIPLDPIEAFKLAKKVAKTTRVIWWELRHDGKEKYGSVTIDDGNGGTWKIRVRWTGNRGNYLKIDSKDNHAIKYLVSAEGYRPEKYLQITEAQWEPFLRLAKGEDSPGLMEAMSPVLDHILQEIEKHPELNRVQD
jgi:hypothetical protein